MKTSSWTLTFLLYLPTSTPRPSSYWLVFYIELLFFYNCWHSADTSTYPSTLLFNLNWRIITLQCYDGLCHTPISIGHRHTCDSFLLNHPYTSFPTPSFQVVTSFGFPCHTSNWLSVLHIYTHTHIYVYVSMLFSQIIPPSPSSTVSKNLFFISVSPLLSCT